MGSIVSINMHPRSWNVEDRGLRLKKEYGECPIVKVRYGIFDDDPGGAFDLEMYMREDVYQRLLSGEYLVDPNSRYKKTLLVLDKQGRPVPPIKEDFCY